MEIRSAMKTCQANMKKLFCRFRRLTCIGVALFAGCVAEAPRSYSAWLGEGCCLGWNLAETYIGAALQPQLKQPVGIAGSRS